MAGLTRIRTRLWLLAGFMAVATSTVGILTLLAASYLDLIDTSEQMPPRARAELDRLVASGQRGSDRYFEIYDRYSGDELRGSDVTLMLVVSLLSTLAGAGVVMLLSRGITRPVIAVADASARFAGGDHAARADRAGASGELLALVDSFNAMAATIESYERERSVLTAGIAHELRTPLTILRGRLHGLVDGVIEPASGEAERLLDQVDRLGRLVDDLRVLAHAEAGELAIDRQLVDVATVVRTVARDLDPMAKAAGVALSVHAVEAPAVTDAVRLWQVLVNLATNAIKHSPAGGRVELRATKLSDGAVAILVSDEGAGFDPADRNRLFMPFWRAEADRLAGLPGSGLGLALAARIVAALGGRIEARSRRGGTPGAVFCVHLPSSTL